MPLFTNRDTYGPAPLEGNPESWSSGMVAAADLALEQSFEATALVKSWAAQADGPHISFQDAARQMSEQNYPTDGIPKDGLTQGALDLIMRRQSDMRQNSSVISRANVGSAGRFVAGLVGTAPSPLMWMAPEARLLNASRGGRLAIGGGVGAGYGALETYGQQAVGHSLGDDDATDTENLRAVLFGAAIGGGLHVSFGGRAPVVSQPRGVPGSLTLGEISQLERSSTYAQAHGIPESEVTSSAGAVGKYQVTPDTARTFGLDPTRLKDPAYNERAAQMALDDLQRRFPGDAEAQAIGYNAGPGRAQRWLDSGRDMRTIPAEARAYLARLQGLRDTVRIEPTGEISKQVDALPAQVRSDAAQTAIAQFAADSPINVDPIISRLDNLPEMPKGEPLFANSSPPPLRDAIPRPDAVLTEDPALRQRLANIENVYGNQGRPIAPLEEAQVHTDAATNEAIKTAQHSDPVLAQQMAEEFTAHNTNISDARSYVKAVQAALECGATKGLL